ncbi:P-II family nitrogen regulator [Vagococcus sp. JNUCC 83]
MKKVEAIIKQEKLSEIQMAIDSDVEIKGMTVVQVLGVGLQKGQVNHVRGNEVITNLIPKVSVSFIVTEKDVDYIVDLIMRICQSDEIGTGKIFISPIEEVIRIRTGERGYKAISESVHDL